MSGRTSVLTDEPPTATPSLDEVLERMAVRDVDPEAATEFAMGVVAARLKRRRVVLGAGAVTALVASVTLALLTTRGPNPDEVVTPADARTTTTEAPNARKAPRSSTTSTTTPATSAPIITNAAPTTTAVQPTITLAAPPTTVPATDPAPSTAPTTALDRPGSGTLEVASGAAGELLDLRFEFTDPDGPGGAPSIAVSTDEPGTPRLTGSPQGPSGACGGGSGSTATLHDRVQFASTGARTVSVAVKYCDGPARVFNTTVTVTPPRFGDGQGRAVMAELPDIGPALADGAWSFRPDSGSPVALTPPGGDLSHDLGSRGGYSLRGVVLVLPAGTPGAVKFEVDGARYTGTVTAAVDPGGVATRVTMHSEGSG